MKKKPILIISGDFGTRFVYEADDKLEELQEQEQDKKIKIWQRDIESEN